MWLVAQLPYRLCMALGTALGWFFYSIGSRRKQIARINLAKCFPALTEREREQRLRQHFVSLGKSAIETALCWYAPEDTLRSLAHIEGREHLDHALAQGKGVMLLGAHFTHLEIGATLMTFHFPICAMYRPHTNPLLDKAQRQGRDRFTSAPVVERNDMRGMLRALKAGNVVWYAPDQDYGRQHSVFVPFFDISTATITATSRIAKISRAPVVPFFAQRRNDGKGYHLWIRPALSPTEFPSENVEADARHINALIEREILQQPADYLWVHRRFKTRPLGEQKFYGRRKKQTKPLAR
jgi:Kdo2-lipid IVA lauroyltransferase/acyltransferase